MTVYENSQILNTFMLIYGFATYFNSRYCNLRTEIFPLRLMAQARTLNRTGKARNRENETKETRLRRYLLYLYFVSDRFGNDLHS